MNVKNLKKDEFSPSIENLKYRVQRRIGIIFGIFLLYLTFRNYFVSFVFYKNSLFSFENFVYSFQLIQAIIFFWTIRPKIPRLKRTLQIFIILIDGFLTLIMSPTQIFMGLSLLIFGCLLLLQYDFFESKKINYVIIIILLLVTAIASFNSFSPNTLAENPNVYSKIQDPHHIFVYKIWLTIDRVVFVALFLILFPSIYIDQVGFFKSLNLLVVKEKESLATFANIAMLLNSTIHNFNNKIVTLLSSEYIISTTLKKYDESMDKNDLTKLLNACEMIKKVSDDMTIMIKNMRNLVKDKTNNQLQTYELNTITEDIVKQFQVAYEKSNVEISLIKSKEPIYIKGNQIHFIQIIENLIKNSIEASIEPKIKIILSKSNDAIVKIIDNGHGIPFCFNCKKNKCVTCEQFQIGKTTKPDGSGTGMVYVQSTLKDMNSYFQITSKPDEGTQIEIHLKNLASAEIDEISQLYLGKKASDIAKEIS